MPTAGSAQQFLQVPSAGWHTITAIQCSVRQGVHTRRNAVYLAQCTENCVGVMSLAARKLQLRESQSIQDPLGPGKPYFITKDLGYNKMSLTDFYHFLK